jgi:hypothetical protein
MKPFYQSKTFWFNLLAGLVAVAGLFGYAEFKPSADVLQIISVLVAAINIALRFVTKTALTLK